LDTDLPDHLLNYYEIFHGFNFEHTGE